jgi:VCBS repeat-containing protein
VTVTINGTNDAPVLTVDDSGGVTEDVGVSSGNLTDSGTLSFTDLDSSDTHLVSSSYNGDASWSDGTLTAGQIAAITAGFSADSDSWDYSVANADLDFLGAGETITLSFDVTVEDDSGETNDSDTKAVTITITGTNDSPTVESVIADQHVDEDNPWSFAVPAGTFGDPDANDALSFSATLGNGDPLPDWLAFDPDTQTFTGTPPQDWNGTVSLTVTASDGTLSTSDTFDLVVDAVNDAPEATVVVLDAIAEDSGARLITQAELLAGASDVDGDSLVVTSLGIAAGDGTLVDNLDGTWTYTPAADDDTSVTFNYTVSDGSLTDSSTATMDILPVDDFVYTSPPPYTGTGDPNDFDSLGNPLGQNLSSSATNGNDTIYGGAGADTINGGGGDDIIFGGSGGDALGGGNDGDTLDGGSGADAITGGNNHDRIIGGYGADTLTGGGGADTFAYLSNLDTGDRITDFSQAQGDKLDLSAVGATSGGFLGAISQPGAVGAHQVGYMYDSGTNTTIVYVDTDGIFGADQEINLTGNIALVSGDFVFGGP